MGTDDMKEERKGKRPRINEKIRHSFHEHLATWYRSQARDLPWRRTMDPYAITVSEFMLQQTQVVTVIPYYERWLKRFPTWNSLVLATEEEVLKAWEGLGYYSRARNLKRLAQQVVERGGSLPEEPDKLIELSGIGPYTAGALASLAFGRRAALVDGNVMRVFARVFNWTANISDRATQEGMWRLAECLLPQARDCATHNSALMELGATICIPGRPLCLACPLRQICRAKDPEKLPIKSRSAVTEREEKIALISKDNRWWLERGPVRGRLAGFWRFPAVDPSKMKQGHLATKFTYGITRYRVTLESYFSQWKQEAQTEGRWFTIQELEKIPMSAAHGRLRSFVVKMEEGPS